MTDPYASGVLTRDKHERLVANIGQFARDANLPNASFIWRPLDEFCEAQELEWFRRFRFHSADGWAGMAYVGVTFEPDPATRMAALCGGLTRNFVWGRLETLESVLKRDYDAAPSCLLIPNFLPAMASYKETEQWRVGLVSDLLNSRWTSGKQTVISIPSFEALDKTFGSYVGGFVRNHYKLVKAPKPE